MKTLLAAKLEPGKYIVAVSGGVDSVVLLNMLSKLPEVDLVVAHFDHGIREDSAKDKEFVEKLAKNYGTPFVSETAALGPDSSEATAREARYEFLYKVMGEQKAKSIVTAHHQDDVLETIIINLSRGTGRKGLSPMTTRPGIVRPLLEYSKAQILDYALAENLKWREDSTNTDTKYFRNYVRLHVIPKMTEQQKRELLDGAKFSHKRNEEIDELINVLMSEHQNDEFNREGFVVLPHNVAGEVLAQLLRKNNLAFDRKNIEKLVVALKTLPAGSRVPISGGVYFAVGKKTARIIGSQSV